MRVLIACEFSGKVRDAFLKLGHDAMSCDLLPTESPGPHYEGDVFDVIDDGWDMMVAHPPCTYLANSGVQWLYKQEGRWEKMQLGALFFAQLLEADIPHIAVENPIMHGYAKKIIGMNQTQLIQPYQFGHTERKATCLWLLGLPPLVPTNDVKDEMDLLPKARQQRLHWLPPSVDRAKLRSETFQGIADAMAGQWGFLCPNCGADETTDHPDGESGWCPACEQRVE